MNTGRPVHLNVFRLRLPIGGWVSILHRASGLVLALSLPGLLYLFMRSLRSAADFAWVTGFLVDGPGVLVTLVLLWAGMHHLLAGLRHLGFDAGLGKGLARSRLSALTVLVLGLGLALILGLMLVLP